MQFAFPRRFTDSANVGQVTQTLNNPRLMQVALKLKFELPLIMHSLRCYSVRSARIGSNIAAFRAGTSVATRAAAANTTEVISRILGA